MSLQSSQLRFCILDVFFKLTADANVNTYVTWLVLTNNNPVTIETLTPNLHPFMCKLQVIDVRQQYVSIVVKDILVYSE